MNYMVALLLMPAASLFVLLRNKPLEIVDELKIALLLRQPAQRASRLRRLAQIADATTLESSKCREEKGRAVVTTAALLKIVASLQTA
jgi:hypothetical protein